MKLATIKINWRAVWKEVASKADYAADPMTTAGWEFRLYDAEKRAIKKAVEKQIRVKLTPELIEVLNDDAEEDE